MQAAENEKLRAEIEQLRATRDAAQLELEQLRGSPTPAADLAAADALRTELSVAQAEINQLTAQLAEAPDATGLEERLAAAESERQQLENELDLLRHRGAELIEQLAEQKRTAASDRESWSEELRQLRKAVEMQSEALAQRGGTIPVMSSPNTPTVVDAPRAPQANGSRADDSVLGSVMEQFESLQKNKVRKLTTPKR